MECQQLLGKVAENQRGNYKARSLSGFSPHSLENSREPALIESFWRGKNVREAKDLASTANDRFDRGGTRCDDRKGRVWPGFAL